MQGGELKDLAPGHPPAGTLAGTIYQQMHVEIASGLLPPGSRLDEQALAQRFKVSRTPVREALRLLAADELVELGGRHGAAVRSFGVHRLIEIFQVMGELEGLCARLAARRITGDQGRMLRAAHEAVIQAASAGPDRFYEANQLFHETIYAASCNAVLTAQTRKLRNKVAASRRRVTRMPGRIEDTIAEHQEIMTAILAHDAEGAHRRVRNHLALLGGDLMDFIASFDRDSPGTGPDPEGAALHAGAPQAWDSTRSPGRDDAGSPAPGRGMSSIRLPLNHCCRMT